MGKNETLNLTLLEKGNKKGKKHSKKGKKAMEDEPQTLVLQKSMEEDEEKDDDLERATQSMEEDEEKKPKKKHSKKGKKAMEGDGEQNLDLHKSMEEDEAEAEEKKNSKKAKKPEEGKKSKGAKTAKGEKVHVRAMKKHAKKIKAAIKSKLTKKNEKN